VVPFAYESFPHPIREGIPEAHRAVWTRLAGPGSHWTGEQRVEIARQLRAARARRSEPPWLREQPAGAEGALPAAAVEAVHRIAIDAHRLDRVWCESVVKALGDAAYVELVAVVVCVTAIDAFAEALGVDLEPLPVPRRGEPDGNRPDGMGDGGAWVPMSVPWQGPNVARALSMAPEENATFMVLVDAMYAVRDFTVLVWERPLTRPQVELVAARVSAVNECFY